MSGSLYPYTPYQGTGQPESPGQAFRGGFLGAQQIEGNVQEMERRRQAARLAELQEQRSQAQEQRTQQRFPLEMKQTAVGIQQRQALAPLELDTARLNVRGTQLRLQAAEQELRDRAALSRMLQEGFPTINFGGVPQAAPAVGVTPPPAQAPAAAPSPQAGVSGSFPPLAADFGERRFRDGVQLASAGINDFTGLPTGMSAADLTGAGAPVGMPVQSAPPPTTIAPGAAPAPGEMEMGLVNLPPPEPGSSLARFLAARTPEQLRRIIANGTPSTVYGQRRGVTAGAASLAAAASEELARRPAAGAATGAATGAAATAPAEPEVADRSEEVRFRPVTTAADRAVANNTPPSQPYLDQPMRVQADLNRLQTEYGDLQRLYRIAALSRDTAAATRVVARVREIQNEVNLLRGMQALTSFRDGDDAPLASAISQATNGQMQIQRAPNGTYNVFRNGRQVNTNVPGDQIVANARLYFDTEFRERIQAERQQQIAASILRANEEIKQTARASAEILIERNKQALAQLRPDIDVRMVTGADGAQMLVYTDKRTGATVGGARITQVPPPPGSPRGTPSSLAIEAIPLVRN